MARARIYLDREGRYIGLFYNCPGCGDHLIYTDWTPEGLERAPRSVERPIWQFNGNLDRPTFKPSVLAWWGPPDNDHKNVCHSFVTDGRVQFLNDCTHALRGKTVDLPEIEEPTDG